MEHIVKFTVRDWQELVNKVNELMKDGFLLEKINTDKIYGDAICCNVLYCVEMAKVEIEG